ncbi:hypothetical protein [Pedosphaera parvula]|nr:hypothetical protein [Pedosphaera parvula]
MTSGCGKHEATPGVTSAYSGFVCAACGAKFYVSGPVSGESCPQCKRTEVQPVLAFVCATDGHTTIDVRRSRLIPCEQCKAQTTSFRDPTEGELQAWGAVQKPKADVAGK